MDDILSQNIHVWKPNALHWKERHFVCTGGALRYYRKGTFAHPSVVALPLVGATIREGLAAAVERSSQGVPTSFILTVEVPQFETWHLAIPDKLSMLQWERTLIQEAAFASSKTGVRRPSQSPTWQHGDSIDIDEPTPKGGNSSNGPNGSPQKGAHAFPPSSSPAAPSSAPQTPAGSSSSSTTTTTTTSLTSSLTGSGRRKQQQQKQKQRGGSGGGGGGGGGGSGDFSYDDVPQPWVAQTKDTKRDEVPTRFLVSCGGDASEAARRWASTWDWRRENRMDELTTCHFLPHERAIDELKRLQLHFYHRRARNGKCVFYDRLNPANYKKILAVFSDDPDVAYANLIKYYMFVGEYAYAHLCPEDPGGTTVTVYDLSCVTFWSLFGPTIELAKDVTNICALHYPERADKVFLINAPGFFSVLWKIIRPLVDPRTRDRVSISTSDRSELIAYVGAENVPRLYGGRDNKMHERAPEEEAFRSFVRAAAKDNGYAYRKNQQPLSPLSSPSSPSKRRKSRRSSSPSKSPRKRKKKQQLTGSGGSNWRARVLVLALVVALLAAASLVLPGSPACILGGGGGGGGGSGGGGLSKAVGAAAWAPLGALSRAVAAAAGWLLSWLPPAGSPFWRGLLSFLMGGSVLLALVA